MKVTFCTLDACDFTAGPSSHLRRLLVGLTERNIQCEVLAFVWGAQDSPLPLIDELRRLKIPCHTAPLELGDTKSKVGWILDRLRESPPDIFVPNYVVPAYFAARWVREAGIATIGMLHSDDEFHRGILDGFVFGPARDQLDALVCVSEFLYNFVQSREATATKCYQIPSGIPFIERKAVFNPPEFKIAYLGRLVQEQKRIKEVVDALCRASSEIPNVRANIFGDGNERSWVIERLRSEKGHHVTYAGSIANRFVTETLLNHQALTLLSDYEGLPIALLEAMACGVVPICLPLRSGISEIVLNLKTGMIVNDRGDDYLRAVRELTSNPRLWEELSKGARQLIREKYSNARECDLWMAVFDEQRKTRKVQSIRRPFSLSLPPVDPRFSFQDRRNASLVKRVARKVRRFIRRAA